MCCSFPFVGCRARTNPRCLDPSPAAAAKPRSVPGERVTPGDGDRPGLALRLGEAGLGGGLWGRRENRGAGRGFSCRGGLSLFRLTERWRRSQPGRGGPEGGSAERERRGSEAPALGSADRERRGTEAPAPPNLAAQTDRAAAEGASREGP
eukprot:Hpha_TRINITY_DN16461_c0_g2::TRINITY_DN16461_c0_g2_i1::g.159965::m.159965